MRCSSLVRAFAASALVLAPLGARAASNNKGHFIYPVQGQSYKFFVGDTVNFTWSVVSDYATFSLNSDDRNSSVFYGAVTGLDGNNGSLAKQIDDDTPPGIYYAEVVNYGADFNVSYFEIANKTAGHQPTTWNAWDGKTHPTPTGSTSATSHTTGTTSVTSAAATSSEPAFSKARNGGVLGLGAKIAIILGIVLVLVVLCAIGGCIFLRRKPAGKKLASPPSADGANLPELKRNSKLGLNTKPQAAGYYEMDAKVAEFKGYEMSSEDQYSIQRPQTAASTLAPSYGSPTPPPPGTGYAHPGYAGYGQAGAYNQGIQTPISPPTPVGSSLPQNHGFVFSNPPVEVSGQSAAVEMPSGHGNMHYQGVSNGVGWQPHGTHPRQHGSYPANIAEMAG